MKNCTYCTDFFYTQAIADFSDTQVEKFVSGTDFGIFKYISGTLERKFLNMTFHHV
jgi:hypothetical protein